MRYDLVHDRQLPDLRSFQPPFQAPPEMFFGMAYGPDGTLYVLRGARIDLVNAAGETLRSIPLEGFGWATIAVTADGRFAYVGNFFTGQVAKFALGAGTIVRTVNTGQARALAGIAVRAGRVRKSAKKRIAKKKVARRKAAGSEVVARKKKPVTGKSRKAAKRPTGRAVKKRPTRRAVAKHPVRRAARKK
jgi:hypothetical protein